MTRELRFCGAWSLEPPVRIELTTFRLQGECSTTELRRQEPQRIGQRLSSSSAMTRSDGMTRGGP
jgi:hypothetical protein